MASDAAYTPDGTDRAGGDEQRKRAAWHYDQAMDALGTSSWRDATPHALLALQATVEELVERLAER